MPERVEGRAPTRIDLAGGTMDLWPLYLLHDRPLTVNAAIDLFARASIESTAEGAVEVISRDRDSRVRAETPGGLSGARSTAGEALEFPLRLAAHFLDRLDAPADRTRSASCRITTDCMAPAGSGLGGSSALGIALASVLNRYTGRGLEGERLLSLTRAIETQVIKIPTGEQDYHPALHGGVLALHYGVEGTQVERLDLDAEALRRRTVLVFTGVSRSSGISNWDMIKRHLDGDAEVRGALDTINDAAHAMREALLSGDWDRAGEALAEEWEARRRMSPKVTTPAIDGMIEAARAVGAQAGKVCGAGGGGCLVLWVKEGRRPAVIERVAGLGGAVLDFRYVREGVVLTEA